MSDSSIYLASAVRTPIGKFGGGLRDLSAADLGTHAGTAAIHRADIDPGAIDQTLFGHARQAGGGPNVARQISLRCGIPVSSPAYTINQACMSGMQSILGAYRAIRCDEAQLVLAGGTEAMSQIPYFLEARWGFRMGHQDAVDAMYRDGYLDPICGKIMGETAETLVEQFEISRLEQDSFAATSQNRAEAAWDRGDFAAEVEPIVVEQRKGELRVERDEHCRAGVTAESLAKLPAVFKKGGSVTPGNSSGITDGASALLVASEEAVKEHGLKPHARIVDYVVDGVAPEVMGLGPVPAVQKLLARQKLELDQIDLIELNEAFAAQAISVNRELGFDTDRVNVQGGAIALGHPSGCSGNRIVVTLCHLLERQNKRLGLATLCVSGGIGGALLIERT